MGEVIGDWVMSRGCRSFEVNARKGLDCMPVGRWAVKIILIRSQLEIKNMLKTEQKVTLVIK
jgi:hypothetical protein